MEAFARVLLELQEGSPSLHTLLRYLLKMGGGVSTVRQIVLFLIGEW